MKTKKKIAFITPLYLPANLSGSSVVIRDVAEELVRQGYDISIVTSNARNGRYWYDPIFGKKINESFEIINGVKIFRLPCNQYLSSFLFIAIRIFPFILPSSIRRKWEIKYNGPSLIGLQSLLEKENFTVLHSSPIPLNINKQVSDVVKRLSITPKYIITPFFHSEVKQFYSPEIKTILNNADVIHAVTNVEKLLLHKIFSISLKKIMVIPLFIQNKLQNNEKLRQRVAEFKKKYNLKNKKIILFAGNKGHMKGAIDVAETVSQLYKEDDSYVLIVIGSSMPEWSGLKRKLDSTFLLDFGYVSQIEKEIIFASCDVFCMPSQSESFGLTYLEAWSKKKPVIAADIPTSRELVGGNKGGMLVKFNDKIELKHAIIELCGNKSLSAKLGGNGYRALHKKYDFTQFIEKFEKILE